MNILRYCSGLFVTAALLTVGHWFPWPRPLRRIESYTYGVVSILAGIAVWIGFSEAWFAIAGFALIGGLVTAGATLYDHVMNWRVRASLFHLEDRLGARRTEDS